MEYYIDEECRARYRFGKSAIEFVLNHVHNQINPPTNSSYSLSATKQVLIKLRFLATRSFLPVTGDTFAGLRKSTVSRVVRRVCLTRTRKPNQFVKFSESREVQDQSEQGIYQRASFHVSSIVWTEHAFALSHQQKVIQIMSTERVITVLTSKEFAIIEVIYIPIYFFSINILKTLSKFCCHVNWHNNDINGSWGINIVQEC